MTGWIFRMALRDSRGSRRRLLLFVLSMSVGVAALVAINGFGANLGRAVEEQALGLLGADLGLESDLPFADSTEALIRDIVGEAAAGVGLDVNEVQARRTTFASMAYFPRQQATRIVSVRATSGSFPFYGTFETAPTDAADTYRDLAGALIDPSLATQFGLSVGDTMRVGQVYYPIVGTIEQTSSEPAFVSLVSPRVYVPLAGVDEELLAFGSRVDYEIFFRLGGIDVEALAEDLDGRLPREVEIHTVDREREAWSEALGNLYRFLGLIALTALLLGSIGVASAIHVYIQQRRQTVALLRCVGVTPKRAMQIYLLQASLLGLVGAAIGAAAGTLLQFLVPGVLAQALPFEIDMRLYPGPILVGLFAGVGITLLFAWLPLLAVRDVSPLSALRADVETGQLARTVRSPRRLAALVAAAVGVLTFGAFQGPTPTVGLAYVIGIAVVLAVLGLVAWGATHLVRKLVSPGLTYPVRQGLANLYRPSNQTRLILLAVGFGAFIVFTLLIVRSTLLSQVRLADEGERPNLIFFDVQPDQLEAVRTRVVDLELPVVEEAPIVTMRLAAIGGRDFRAEREGEAEQSWAVDHEYRSTYRAQLTETETLIDGTFVGTYDGTGPVPISLEQDIALELDVAVGDTMVFDVQGRQMTTLVSSIRLVDWNRMQTNFFVVFPTGVLERAPQTWVLVSRAASAEQSGGAQAAVVSDFPNVSAIDLSLIIGVLEDLFAQLSAVIQFMALFSIVTGLVILAGAVVVSRYRRIDEVVLLKTLGASRAVVRRISAVEYLSLGVLASTVALLLSVPVGWLLAKYAFETPIALPFGSLAVAAAAVAGITMLIGVANSRGIYAAPALQVLRGS